MNDILITKLSDLQTVINSPIYLSGDKNLQSLETEKNMWALLFEPSLIKQLAVHDLITFFSMLIAKKEAQVLKQDSVDAATFYLWFDEMAAQLRFNIISGCNGSLPFDCDIQFVDNAQILGDFLHSKHHEGISWNELETLDETDQADDEKESYVLKVFSLCLPAN